MKFDELDQGIRTLFLNEMERAGVKEDPDALLRIGEYRLRREGITVDNVLADRITTVSGLSASDAFSGRILEKAVDEIHRIKASNRQSSYNYGN